MTKDKFHQIMAVTLPVKKDVAFDKTLAGLLILAKCTSRTIQGTGNGMIYSEDVDILIASGISEYKVTRLAELEFYIEDNHLCKDI